MCFPEGLENTSFTFYIDTCFYFFDEFNLIYFYKKYKTKTVPFKETLHFLNNQQIYW